MAERLSAIEQYRFEDSLTVTDFDPLIADATSAPPVRDAMADDTLEAARACIDSIITTDGAHNIQKVTGILSPALNPCPPVTFEVSSHVVFPNCKP